MVGDNKIKYPCNSHGLKNFNSRLESITRKIKKTFKIGDQIAPKLEETIYEDKLVKPLIVMAIYRVYKGRNVESY